MTEVTVAIELSDDMLICREAVRSVLAQSDVTFNIVLIGTNREIGTELCTDPRIAFLQVERTLQPGGVLKALAKNSSTPFVMCLRSHDHLLPGALATLVRALDTSPENDMVYAPQFAADQDGHIHREVYLDEWQRAKKLSRLDPAQLADLLHRDFVPDGLRIFRRQPLLSRIFAGSRRCNPYTLLYSMHSLLRPRFLGQPMSISRGAMPFRRRKHAEPGNYLLRTYRLLASRQYPANQFRRRDIMARGLEAYWKSNTVNRRSRIWSRKFQQRWSTAVPGFSWYRILGRVLQKMPLIEPRSLPGVMPGAKSVGYYIWQYPVLSQTFVQREVAALRRSGCDLVVFSENAPEHEFIIALQPELAGTAQPLPTLDADGLKRLKQTYFRRYPLRYLRLWLYVVSCRYHYVKSRRFDRITFAFALKLASHAEQRGIQHLHSPWADRCAFVALIASRLLGISCSVQARAHDIHRNSYTIGLKPKFENVDFIVTNTAYNAGHIRSILGPEHSGKVRQVYNGLNLEQFNPAPRSLGGRSEIRLLCVGRLVEQKGIDILLHACRRLLDDGVNLRCDIVGGEEEEGMNVYIRLMRLHRELGLQRNVRFVGPVPFDAVLACQQEADIFVLPCVIAGDGSRDIIPNSVLEAMAMKLPVVSTAVTGLPEMVDQGTTGYLVPPGDAAALAAAILKLCESHALRLEFGEAGRLKVEQMFDSGKNVLAYKRLFEGQETPLT